MLKTAWCGFSFVGKLWGHSEPEMGHHSDVPIFEFLCQGCGKKFATLVGMTAEADDEACPHCGSKSTRRLVSRIAKFRTEDGRIDELADRFETLGEPDSPEQMRELVKDMGRAMDDDMADEMEEMFEADMEGRLDDED